jgi:hypothetical protein
MEPEGSLPHLQVIATRPYILFNNTYLIQGNQKVSVHLMITIQKVTSNVQSVPTSLLTFIDTPNCVLEDRFQYSTVHIANVFCDGHLQIINCTVL